MALRRLRRRAIGPGGSGVASWRRHSSNTSFALSVDPYGALWVVGWPTSGRVHAVLRLVRGLGGAWAVSGWDIGSGALLPNGARAGSRGVSVAVQGEGRRGPSILFHATSRLRGGPGGESACF